MKIGVLAIQGDFDAHRRRLEELGAEVVLVPPLDDVEHEALQRSATVLRRARASIGVPSAAA